jgi:hypothetical protein
MKTQTQITFARLTMITAIALAFTFCSPERTSAAPPPKLQSTATPTNSAPSRALTNSMPQKVTLPTPENPVVKHQLTGAELYSVNCNRCHPERYPTERTAAQWKTIMLHMQVRANIPVSQAKLILKYLQDNSGR